MSAAVIGQRLSHGKNSVQYLTMHSSITVFMYNPVHKNGLIAAHAGRKDYHTNRLRLTCMFSDYKEDTHTVTQRKQDTQ